MPKKIKFKVLRASGEDEKYKASELESHGPSVRGWLSSRNCTFPQEILFVLLTPAVIHQIQILAHHYIIPERIDVWIGNDSTDPTQNEEGDNICFDYIGYITLSNNENTKFKCRELKTISIPSLESTKYIKLSLYENHPINLNAYNQVGLVAIQILGEEVSENKINPLDVAETSCFDDLAFEMYVDQEIAELLKQLEEKKKKAVSDERFEYARKLKSAMAKLHLAGEKLGKMETSKKQAIQQEDYSKAKKKKLQIEEFRSQIYGNLNIENLLEKNGIVASNDEESDQDNETINRILFKDDQEPNLTAENTEVDSKLPKKTPSVSHIPSDSVVASNTSGNEAFPGVYESPVSPLHTALNTENPLGDVPASSKQPSSKTGSLRRRNKCQSNTRNSYESGDENTVGTFRPYCQPEFKEPTSNSILSHILLQSKLNEREKKQAILSISVFGKNLVEKIFSKQYSDKEESLKMLEASLKSFIEKEKENKLPSKTHSSSKIARASTYLLHRCLRDKVFAVYSAATEVIRFFFTEFVKGRVPASEIARCIELLLPDLLSKAGDTTPRVHNLAVHTILSLADAAEVRKLNIIPGHLTRILTANIHARLALSRLEMVEQLILNHGISSDKQSGMTCRILAEFGLSGLHHPAEAVRKMAEKILVLVYHSNPRLVRKQLPPDDDVTRRNILYRHLMQEFDRVDSERKNLSRSDISEKEIVSKYSSCFGKTLHKTKSEQKLRRCTFCHLESESLTEKELNIHYWKYCPLLMRCTHCNQVIEIAALNEHLTGECEMKALFRKCQVCSQAVSIKELNSHHTSVQCTLMIMKNVCPLCFTQLEEGEDKLRIHLTGRGSSACSQHPRAKYVAHNVSLKTTKV